MQLSDIPNKSPLTFAQSATGSYIRTVPQTSADPDAASFTLGFPPNTFTDEGAGGVPPDGRDFNGILNFLSAWSRWLTAGGPIIYDSTFQTAVGGYPLGAVVWSATTAGVQWRSTTNNNVTNPDTGGAGWVKQFNRGSTGGVNWRTWPTGDGTTSIRMSGSVTFNSETSGSAGYPFTLASVDDYGVSTRGAGSNNQDQVIQLVGVPGTTGITLFCNEMGPNHVYPIYGQWFVEGVLA